MVMVVCVYILVTYWDSGERQTGQMIRILRWLGQASMAIYLCHTIFSAGLREVMQSLGLTNAALMLVCTTLIGVVLPAALYRVTRGRRLGRILGF
jgi:peptidoglycan/LPS O-acetylase OafA/YrhL